MKNKTMHYTVVFKNGRISHKMWGGNARSLRISLENEGYQPTAIFQRVRSLWVRESEEVSIQLVSADRPE